MTCSGGGQPRGLSQRPDEHAGIAARTASWRATRCAEDQPIAQNLIAVLRTAPRRRSRPWSKPGFERQPVEQDRARRLRLPAEVSPCIRNSQDLLRACKHRGACTRHPEHRWADALPGCRDRSNFRVSEVRPYRWARVRRRPDSHGALSLEPAQFHPASRREQNTRKARECHSGIAAGNPSQKTLSLRAIQNSRGHEICPDTMRET